MPTHRGSGVPPVLPTTPACVRCRGRPAGVDVAPFCCFRCSVGRRDHSEWCDQRLARARSMGWPSPPPRPAVDVGPEEEPDSREAASSTSRNPPVVHRPEAPRGTVEENPTLQMPAHESAAAVAAHAAPRERPAPCWPVAAPRASTPPHRLVEVPVPHMPARDRAAVGVPAATTATRAAALQPSAPPLEDQDTLKCSLCKADAPPDELLTLHEKSFCLGCAVALSELLADFQRRH